MKKRVRPVDVFSTVIPEKLKGKNRYHCHKSHELYYLTKGHAKYMVGENPFFLQSGNLMFIPSGRMHVTEYDDLKSCRRILLSFDDNIIPSRFRPFIDELSEHCFIYIPKEDLPQIDAIYKKIEDEYCNQNLYKEDVFSLYIIELIVIICRLRQKVPVSKLSSTEILLYNVSKFIQNSFQENLSLDLLSKQFSVNKCYLSRKFKDTFGIGVIEYLTVVRINHAKHLLCDTDYSISRVASECGYNDSNYFSTVFKEEVGITPYKYKKQHMVS